MIKVKNCASFLKQAREQSFIANFRQVIARVSTLKTPY